MNYQESIQNDPNIQKALISAKALANKTMTHPDLPHPFIPASNEVFKEQFYWDSFFIMLGLKECDKKGQEIMKGMVENFFWMFKKYNYIPNSYKSFDTRSQPPFLTSMILLVDKWLNDEKWLEKAYKIAKQEYDFWISPLHLTKTGLSRYRDLINRNGKAIDAENESGWDFTPRFQFKANQICAVDLNTLLYKYEKDFEVMAKKLKKEKAVKSWHTKAETRRDIINEFLWNDKEGLFFDYDFAKKKPLKTKSLAVYVPLWTKQATKHQAEQLVQKLKLFEHEGGLVVTDQDYGSDEQWCYPNGWPPLMWLVINGLRNYGYHEDADRLAYKWLKLCANEYIKKGEWHEKFCVVKELQRLDDKRYHHQAEQYWTMGVFLSLYQQIIS